MNPGLAHSVLTELFMLEVRNSQIAKEFYEIADIMEIKGLNPFRIRAYRNAARTVENLSQPVLDMVKLGTKLDDLPGIGKDLAGKIIYTAQKGQFPAKEEIERGVPRGLLSLLRIPGLGPKRVSILYKTLQVHSVKDLERCCKEGVVRRIHGFGEKTEKRLLKEISKLKISQPQRMKLAHAEQLGAALKKYIEAIPGVEQVVLAGSYRRRKETVGDLDILVTGKGDGSKIIEQVVAYEGVQEVLSKGATRGTMRVEDGFQVDVRFVANESLGAALLYFTGSKPHNIALRTLAQKSKLKINEYGVFRGERRICGRTEAEVYKALKLPYIEPELRENEGEIEAARAGRLPRLIEQKEIRGDLHCHTQESDGMNTLEEMALAAQDLGYEYMAITDHSKSLAMVGGLNKRRLFKQFDEIDRMNGRLKTLKLLKSSEVDILEDGTLDMPDEALARMDLVVCAIHSHFNLSELKQTERVLRAIANPHVNILAHPFGRLIGEREPLALNFKKIVGAMREANCILEINSQPSRLDLSDHHCRMAGDAGVRFVISTDSHHISQLAYMKFGVDVARRGWLTRSQIVNTRSLRDLIKAIKRK